MRDQHHPVEAGNAVPLVSVIIPMLNAAKTIDAMEIKIIICCQSAYISPKELNKNLTNKPIAAIFGARAKKPVIGVGAP